jgi:hypothetical protein
MKPLGRFNEESRDAGSPAAHYLISVCLDSESSIARASFGPPSAFFHIGKIRGFPPNVCLNLGNLRIIVSVILVVRNKFAA